MLVFYKLRRNKFICKNTNAVRNFSIKFGESEFNSQYLVINIVMQYEKLRKSSNSVFIVTVTI